MLNRYRQSGKTLEGPEMERLASALGRVSGEPCLGEAQRAHMKNSLLAMIASDHRGELSTLEGLAQAVSGAAGEVRLGKHQRKVLWAGLLERMVQKGRFAWPSLWIFRNWKSSLASVLTFSILLAIFVVAPLELRLTRASKWTFLESVEGEVYINRNGRIFPADPNFALQEGDLIFTRADSFVAIRYLDDSVTRLGENTSLQISRLFVSPDSAVSTEVELSLISGQVWASVYNLIDGDALFSIETENARADVNSRAAFEISSLDAVTRLAVFENMVDVSRKNGRLPAPQTVVAGFQAEVSSNPFKVAAVDDQIVVQKIDGSDARWVETNLALDQQHLQILKAENEKFVADAVASSQALGLLADFRDGTKSLFANTLVEQARQRFLDAHLGFIKAQEYLVKAERDNDFRRQATPFLIQYRVAVQEIVSARDVLLAADSGQAAALLQMMREEVDLQRKALSLVLPNDNLYTAKQVVEDAGAYFAVTAAERAEYLLGRARNRLLDVQNLIADNNLQDAEAVFRTYLNGLDDLVAEVESAQVSEIEDNLFALLDEQIAQFKLLTAIELELLAKNDQRLTGLVTAVKRDSQTKLINIVLAYRQNGFPLSTVLGLKNTVTEFFPDSEEKLAALADLEKVLLVYPEYLSMKEAEEQQVAEVEGSSEVVVDFEASRDVKVCLSGCAEQQPENTEEAP